MVSVGTGIKTWRLPRLARELVAVTRARCPAVAIVTKRGEEENTTIHLSRNWKLITQTRETS